MASFFDDSNAHQTKLHATELFNRIEAHLNNLERNIENELLSLKTENSHLNSNFKKTKDEMLEMSKNFQLTNDQILKEERNFLELTEEYERLRMEKDQAKEHKKIFDDIKKQVNSMKKSEYVKRPFICILLM